MEHELEQFLADLEGLKVWYPSKIGDMFYCGGPSEGYRDSRTVHTIVDIHFPHVLCLPEHSRFTQGAWSDLEYFTLEGLKQDAEEGWIQKVTGPATMLALYYEYGHESESQSEARRLRDMALDEHNQEQDNKRTQVSQDAGTKSLAPKDLHPDLVCDINPDPKPSWPKRQEWPAEPLTTEPAIEVGLFDNELIEFLNDLDELE